MEGWLGEGRKRMNELLNPTYIVEYGRMVRRGKEENE